MDRERKRLADALSDAPPTGSGMVPVADSALYVADSGGRGPVVVYLKGASADHTHWTRVIAELGDGYRHITYDTRARGRSKPSADYSFESVLRDLETVLDARGVERAIFVGWSLGRVLAWQLADRHPDRVLGSVIVDAFPAGRTGEADAAAIRKMFGRWRLILPVASHPRPCDPPHMVRDRHGGQPRDDGGFYRGDADCVGRLASRMSAHTSTIASAANPVQVQPPMLLMAQRNGNTRNPAAQTSHGGTAAPANDATSSNRQTQCTGIKRNARTSQAGACRSE